MKPKFFFYPIVDAIDVSKYLSELYDEEIDVIKIFDVNTQSSVEVCDGFEILTVHGLGYKAVLK